MPAAARVQIQAARTIETQGGYSNSGSNSGSSGGGDENADDQTPQQFKSAEDIIGQWLGVPTEHFSVHRGGARYVLRVLSLRGRKSQTVWFGTEPGTQYWANVAKLRGWVISAEEAASAQEEIEEGGAVHRVLVPEVPEMPEMQEMQTEDEGGGSGDKPRKTNIAENDVVWAKVYGTRDGWCGLKPSRTLSPNLGSRAALT